MWLRTTTPGTDSLIARCVRWLSVVVPLALLIARILFGPSAPGPLASTGMRALVAAADPTMGAAHDGTAGDAILIRDLTPGVIESVLAWPTLLRGMGAVSTDVGVDRPLGGP